MDFMSVGQSSSPSKTRSKHSFGLHIESDLLTITGSSKSRDVKQLTFGVKKSHQMFSGKSERDSHEGNVCEGWGPGLTPWPGPNECQFRISSSKHSLKSVDYTWFVCGNVGHPGWDAKKKCSRVNGIDSMKQLMATQVSFWHAHTSCHCFLSVIFTGDILACFLSVDFSLELVFIRFVSSMCVAKMFWVYICFPIVPCVCDANAKPAQCLYLHVSWRCCILWIYCSPFWYCGNLPDWQQHNVHVNMQLTRA